MFYVMHLIVISQLNCAVVSTSACHAGGPGSRPGRVFFFRGTHNVRDDLQLSHFVG